ncbi:hypothetical protein BYT27DRAFT_7190916 [Phlegmacium glaucopus]|nr:hypothetical protein BYT27DRAFT_7199186 [Phlegmacium glaucopus]KAF8806723.1 hypothetical protein BYT27DRAFT_7190916 [Phlegmacium glaucopus]
MVIVCFLTPNALVLNRLQGLMHTVYLGLINVFVFLDRQLIQQTTSPLVKASVLE